VPELVCLVVQDLAIAGSHHVAIRIHVRQDYQFRSGSAGANLGCLKVPETLAESDLLSVVDPLVGENENRMPMEGVCHLGEGGIVNRLREIQAGDLGGQVLMQRRDGNHGDPRLNFLLNLPTKCIVPRFATSL
jgi:hypothetical protein